jgi:Tol biopolymer transport system component
MIIIFLIVTQNAIGFVSQDDSTSAIKILNCKTNEIKTILRIKNDITKISISDNGLIAFRINEGVIKIYDRNTGSNQTFKTDRRIDDFMLSNNGELIAYCSEKPGIADDWDLELLDLASAICKPLKSDSNADRSPSFDSKNKSVFFSSGRRGIMKLSSINILSGEQKISLENNKYFDTESAISPDGRNIVFSSNREKSFDIWIFNIKKKALNQLTDDYGLEGNPVWLSNTEIIYEANNPDGWRIWQMNLKSKKKTPLTPEGEKCRYPVTCYWF